MIDLTIIIPHFNSPSYLKDLLETIPAFDNIQIIVVDDRSDKYIEDYIELKNSVDLSYVDFFENTKGRKGAGACRNIGLQEAKGKWILFADADDFFEKKFYEHVQKYFASELDIIFFIPTSVDRDTRQVAHRHSYYKEILESYINLQSLKNELQLRYLMSTPWSKMIRRELIETNNIQFDEIIVSNDIAFSTKVGFHMKHVLVSPETIYCVTNNTSSLTKTLTESNYDIRLNVFIWRYNFLKEHLAKSEFIMLDKLNMLAWSKILAIIKYKLGIRKGLYVIKLFKKNSIKVVNKHWVNPLYFFSIIAITVGMIRIFMKDKRFYVKR